MLVGLEREGSFVKGGEGGWVGEDCVEIFDWIVVNYVDVIISIYIEGILWKDGL